MEKKNSNRPSRTRYEQNHPVVSFRVSKELYDSLQDAKEKIGLSYTDIIKAGLGKFERQIKISEKVIQEAYDQGWEKGIDLAMDTYTIFFPCYKCKKEMFVFLDEDKEILKNYIIAHQWQHDDCKHPSN
jgi:hypothetical protein